MSAQFNNDAQMQLDQKKLMQVHKKLKQACQRLIGDRGRVIKTKIDDTKRYGVIVTTHEAAAYLQYQWQLHQGDAVVCFLEPVSQGWSVARVPSSFFGAPQ